MDSVTRVLGEGKSRRYEVRTSYPTEGSTNSLYEVSASQMVLIPPQSIPYFEGEYDPGKHVLAVYPGTNIFYNAIVKANLGNGARVLLQFDDSTVVSREEIIETFRIEL